MKHILTREEFRFSIFTSYFHLHGEKKHWFKERKDIKPNKSKVSLTKGGFLIYGVGGGIYGKNNISSSLGVKYARTSTNENP